MLKPDCVFCDESQIKAEKIEQLFAADSSIHFVFESLNPVVEGHVLVIPRHHFADATEDRYATAMAMSVASRVAQRYEAANIITSIGTAAEQTVFHLTLHVIPRCKGDGLMLPWTPQKRRGGW